MKLQLTAYNKTYSVETEADDYNIEEYFEMFIGILFQSGFHKETIDQAIEDLSESIKQEQDA